MAPRNFVFLLCLLSCSACYRRSNDGTGGTGGPATSLGPAVRGLARFYDVDRSGTASAGDRVVVPFDGAVRANSTDASAMNLPVAGDTLGIGASLAGGPGPDEVTLVLGFGAALKTRQAHALGVLTANAASGIDVAASLPADAIEDASTGADARPMLPIDIAPGLVPGPALASGPASAAVAFDFDRDGDLDLALACSSGGAFLWSGDGDGGFALTVAFGSTPATAIAAADVNRDGRADVLLGTEQDDEVWLADGTGGFVPGGTLPGMQVTTALATVDLDGDGDLDVLAAADDGLHVHLNAGDGTFPAPSATYGGAARALAVADFDRDGDPDVLTAEAGPNRLWTNDGAGLLSQAAALGTRATRALAVADVDVDGDLDFLAGNEEGDVLWLGDGSGAFDSGQEWPAAPTSAAAFADIDADARPDLLLVGETTTGVWLRTGSLFSPLEELATPPLPSAGALALGDFDGDGDPDLALASAGGTTTFAGSLAGTWGSATLSPDPDGILPGPSFSLETGDADRDGDPDLASGADVDVSVVDNERDESFAEDPQVLSVVAGLVRDLAFADVDRDGDLDLLAVRREEFALFLNDGSGTFEGAMTEGLPGSNLSAFSLAIDVGDVDRDGDLDVVVGNLLGVDALIPNLGFSPEGWLGFGERVRLPQAAPMPERTQTTDVALADLDGDGDLDLALTQSGLRPDLVYLNDGTGVFQGSVQQLGSQRSFALAVFDLDFDGDLDLATATELGIVLWTNDGSAQFEPGGTLGGARFHEIELRDVNGDTFPELFALRELPATGFFETVVFDNLGGVFDPDPRPLAFGRAVLALDDLDLDGDVDLAVGFEEPDLVTRPLWNR